MASEETQSPLRYASDLIDEEWEILQPIIDGLEPYTTGRPRMTDLREILNAIFYLNKTGCPWRYWYFFQVFDYLDQHNFFQMLDTAQDDLIASHTSIKAPETDLD